MPNDIKSKAFNDLLETLDKMKKSENIINKSRKISI